MTTERLALRRALISVSDKTGVVAFARALREHDIEILSTGGTAELLADNGIGVVEVSAHTGSPELMDGRVKTLHPKIHGGLLGRRGIDEPAMREHGISPIDLLVVNFYPFEQAIATADWNLEDAIEAIDIGGPAMVRAAAKNYAGVAVLSDPGQYAQALSELDKHGGLTQAHRFRLAVAAFNLIAQYDAAISRFLSAVDAAGATPKLREFPGQANGCFVKVMDLRYGENPHQRAALYRDLYPAAGSLATFRQRQGKALSYNNIADADAAWECVRQFTEPACVIVKHANPCGVAEAASTAQAYERAYRTDPTSAFGGIIAFNRALDAGTAEAILTRQFVEVILAPGIAADALAVTARKDTIRVLDIPPGEGRNTQHTQRVGSGILLQTADNAMVDRSDLRIVSRRQPGEPELDDLLFAWKVAKFVKSNAIVYARERMTIGVGAGQMSRVYSARIAALKAVDENLMVAGSVMASDAFLPFRDGIDAAAEVGIRAVIQPGGSLRDAEVIAAADEHDMAMVFTGMRHFRH